MDATVATDAAVTGLGDPIASLHARWMPQKDGCCGPFWGALALRALGGAGVDGDPVDPDLVAVHAGTSLAPGDFHDALPPGARPRTDYRFNLPVSEVGAGTSERRLARSISALSQGAASVVPVAGPWSAGSVKQLLACVSAAAPEAVVIANWRTGPLWGTRPHAHTLVSYFAGREVQPPPSEWDVGHFVNLTVAVGASERTAVVVRDSYPLLGWEGHHLQPAEAVAAALRRGDGREGGVLAVAPPGQAAALRRHLEQRGFELRHWDNGTPDD